MTSTRFRVAIWQVRSRDYDIFGMMLTSVKCSGAGIGGLTLAGTIRVLSSAHPSKKIFCLFEKIIVALSRYPDIEVEIFEAAEKLAEVGAGIGLFSRKCITQKWTLFIIIIYHLHRSLGSCTEA